MHSLQALWAYGTQLGESSESTMLRLKCCPKPHLLCIEEKKQRYNRNLNFFPRAIAMTCYEGFLLLVREVLGATVGCLGAVLGAVFRVKI